MDPPSGGSLDQYFGQTNATRIRRMPHIKEETFNPHSTTDDPAGQSAAVLQQEYNYVEEPHDDASQARGALLESDQIRNIFVSAKSNYNSAEAESVSRSRELSEPLQQMGFQPIKQKKLEALIREPNNSRLVGEELSMMSQSAGAGAEALDQMFGDNRASAQADQTRLLQTNQGLLGKAGNAHHGRSRQPTDELSRRANSRNETQQT